MAALPGDRLLSEAGPGEIRFLREGLDDPLAGGDAGLDRLLDATGDGRDLLGDHVLATRGLTLDGADLTVEAALAAADDALGPGADLAGLGLPAALEAAQGDAAARRQRLGDVG